MIVREFEFYTLRNRVRHVEGHGPNSCEERTRHRTALFRAVGLRRSIEGTLIALLVGADDPVPALWLTAICACIGRDSRVRPAAKEPRDARGHG
jgi:hypothetical protein